MTPIGTRGIIHTLMTIRLPFTKRSKPLVFTVAACDDPQVSAASKIPKTALIPMTLLRNFK
jgi:hypothetical protein